MKAAHTSSRHMATVSTLLRWLRMCCGQHHAGSQLPPLVLGCGASAAAGRSPSQPLSEAVEAMRFMPPCLELTRCILPAALGCGSE